MNLTVGRSNIVSLVIYRTGPINDLFFSEFSSVLETVAVYNCCIAITGDFNIHVDDPADAHAKTFKEYLDSFNMVQSVVGPTHNCGHTLDLVITRSDLSPSVINVELPQISDHSLVLFQLEIL